LAVETCDDRGTMKLEIDLFWSFRSPYSYLATPRLVELAAKYDLAVHVRPVLPIAVRIEGFFDRVNPLWPPYLFRDCVRIAESLDLPFNWPRPDPIVQEFPSRKVAAEQPYIYRLTRLGVLAAERGRGLPFIREISAAIFGGTLGWHEGTHLAEAAKRAGCDLAEMDGTIAAPAEAARLDAVIAENQAALEKAGHWGVPTMAFRGEPFFGQDRIDLLVWRLRKEGLKER
jgi:2-hydroxychromene-2-carboxylate isomerase